MKWPETSELRGFANHYLRLAILFLAVYGGTNWLTAHREHVFKLYLEAERSIPFVPAFMLVYMSIFAIPLLPLFSLDLRRMGALARAVALATIVAGISFVILPAELAHARPGVTGPFSTLFEVQYTLDLPHNLFPSLHVTYAALILAVVALNEQSMTWIVASSIWLLLLCLSVLLVRQHQLIDIAGGLVLAWACYRFVYRPMAIQG